jgi:hypothetical protein
MFLILLSFFSSYCCFSFIPLPSRLFFFTSFFLLFLLPTFPSSFSFPLCHSFHHYILVRFIPSSLLLFPCISLSFIYLLTSNISSPHFAVVWNRPYHPESQGNGVENRLHSLSRALPGILSTVLPCYATFAYLWVWHSLEPRHKYTGITVFGKFLAWRLPDVGTEFERLSNLWRDAKSVNISLNTVTSAPRSSNYLRVPFDRLFQRSFPLKNVVFWDVALCRSCVNRRFGGTYRLHLQGRKIREKSSETSVNTRPTQRDIPEDDRCESLKSYIGFHWLHINLWLFQKAKLLDVYIMPPNVNSELIRSHTSLLCIHPKMFGKT